MTIASPGGIDRTYLVQFFREHRVDEFAAVSPLSLHAPPGRCPTDLLPGCRTVVLFGRVMGDELFFGHPGKTSREVPRFKRELTDIAGELVRVLRENGRQAVAIRSVTVNNGTIRGSLSLKHCARDAGLGSIGDNALLLSPRFGNRLGLGAVLTDHEFAPYPDTIRPGDLCNHCGACVDSCPERALSPGSLDILRCRNVTGGVPRFLRPLVTGLFRSNLAGPFLTPVANRIARTSAPRCSACLTACPHFHKGGR